MASHGSVKYGPVTGHSTQWWRKILLVRFPQILLLFDCVLAVSMFGLAYVLRVGPDVIQPHFATGLIVPILMILIALFTANGYSIDRSYRDTSYAVEHCVAFTIAYLLALAVNEFLHIETFGAVVSRVADIAGFGLTMASTLIVRRQLHGAVLRESRVRVIGVVGATDLIRQLANDLEEVGDPRKIIAIGLDSPGELLPGNCDARYPDDPVSALRNLPDSCDSIVVTTDFDKIDQELLNALVDRYLRGAAILELDRFYEYRFNRVWLSSVTGSWLLDGELALRRGIVSAQIKRVMDVAISSILLVSLFPLMVGIGLCVLVVSPGPILYRQRRMGRDGKPFTMLKFRTMIVGADREDPYTRENDNRVTPIGALMRRQRLDELPQLWNVLRGELSLVGPRAESLELVQRYEKEIPYYHFRHVVRPGITGLAQVTQGYASSSEAAVRKLEFDLYYVRHYNVLFDLRILLRTFRVVLRGEGR